MSSAKGGKPNQWSARKAQLAVARYKQAGGTYSSKTPQSKTSLNKWTKEKWTTSDGKPARRKNSKGDYITTRYLPQKAWSLLTPNQVKATNRKKVISTKQFVPNTSKAKDAGRKITLR